MGSMPIIRELVVDASMEEVWEAITNPSEMKKWYFDIPVFKPLVGFEFEFYGGDDTRYLHQCKVLQITKGKKIAYTWQYEGINWVTLVTFELFEEGVQTRIRLTHSGLDNAPADNPDLAKENFERGWDQIIGVNLKGHFEDL